jgi:hypothetical protein
VLKVESRQSRCNLLAAESSSKQSSFLNRGAARLDAARCRYRHVVFARSEGIMIPDVKVLHLFDFALILGEFVSLKFMLGTDSAQRWLTTRSHVARIQGVPTAT